MNIRTHMVPQVPMASTAASYAAVTLPCEPWNKPTPRMAIDKPINQSVVAAGRREDAKNRIIRALKDGNDRFEHITSEAFGKRNGQIDDLARLVLSRMLLDGEVTRQRSNDSGRPFIWTLING